MNPVGDGNSLVLKRAPSLPHGAGGVIVRPVAVLITLVPLPAHDFVSITDVPAQLPFASRPITLSVPAG